MTDLLAALLDCAESQTLDRLADLMEARMATRLRNRLGADAPEGGWLDSKGAAAHLGISLNALHKRTRRGLIPAVQESDGGKLYFRRSELDRWRLERSYGA